MTSPVIKRSIVIDGTKTSISIEDAFWHSLKEIALEKRQTISALVSSIKAARAENSNLSSAIRVYILADLRARIERLTQGPSPRADERGSVLTGPVVGR